MQVFSLILFILLQLPLVQTEQFRHYDTEAGLSNNIVYDIYQDHEGFIWIATENGLNRFDGYEFKKYFQEAGDSTSISSNIVRSIVEDEDGNLWIGTYNGLNVFNRKTQSFTRFVELPSKDINRLDLQQLIIDKERRIWFCTLETTGWFDTKTKEFHFLSDIENPFSISLDDLGNVWIQSFNGELYIYERELDKMSKINSDKSASQGLIFWGNYSKNFWSRTHLELPESTAIGTVIPELPQGILPLKMLERNEKELMLASDGGLFSYSTDTKNLKKVDFREKSSSLSNSIRSIYQDRNGGLWVGTLNGVFHFDPYQKLFSHIDVIEESSDVIMGMQQVEKHLLINPFSQALIKYDLGTKKFEKIKFSNPQGVGFYQIWDMEWIQNSQYPIWMATNEGLFLFNQELKVLKPIRLNGDSEKFPVTFSIENTNEDYVWVSSLTALYKLSKESGEVEQTINIDENIMSSIQDIQVFKNIILVATEGEGIFLYDSEKSDFLIPLTRLVPGSTTLLKLPIWDLFLDSKNLIWIGTNQGLLKLDIDRSALTSISSTALKNRVIFSIEEDEQGNLWMGTEKGLIRFDPVTEEVLEFNKSDGVYNVEYNRRSVIKSKNGELFFGGVEGITSFDPQKISINPIIPEVHILEARVVTSDSTFIPEGFYGEEIVLPWNKNTLEFDFVGLNFTNPSLNKYRYKLEGHDPDWVNSEARASRYVQLPHGDYTFKVQASNNDGVWNTEGASLQINISPPVWKTWWFRVFVLILVLLVLWTVYRYRVKQLLEIERVKLRIAGDLHDEIGSGLSGIALTGDILSRQLNNGGPKPELIHRITQSSRSMASSLDAIVWLIDPQKETLGDLISKCQITAQDLLNDKNVRVDSSIKEKEEKEVLSSNARRNLFLFFKEAIHNIAKHSSADEVEIHFGKSEGQLQIDIRDNGVGFDTGQNMIGRGIGTMNQRAEELQSELILESDLGKGTRISLTTKIP